MKKNLYIIGAGDFGREMESMLGLHDNFNNEYEIKGFLDLNSNNLDGKPTDFKFIGSEVGFEFKNDDYVVIAISDSKIRRRVALNLKNRVKFYTYIAPNATIGKYTKIGL